jgi:polyisoprenoid-binding protein YceI
LSIVPTSRDAGGGSTDHLLTADFFDQPNFPSITFKSRKAEFMDKNRARITGDLTVKINREDYGMLWGSEEIERGPRAFDE